MQRFERSDVAWWLNRAAHYTRKGQKEIARRSVEGARWCRLSRPGARLPA